MQLDVLRSFLLLLVSLQVFLRRCSFKSQVFFVFADSRTVLLCEVTSHLPQRNHSSVLCFLSQSFLMVFLRLAYYLLLHPVDQEEFRGPKPGGSSWSL